MEAMSQGGILKISAFSEGPLVGIAFKDTGSGISPEQLGSIFDAYHTTKATGSGLGLMIVQRIIREHGGQIEVDSAPGKGTTIILYLPTEEQRLRLLKAPRNTNDTAPPEEPHP
jgi:two-component system, sporulation sensor kinase E